MKEKICVIGLGYVGLPLAVALSEHFEVIGFDINKKRIEELKNGNDSTRELSEEELKKANIDYATHPAKIKEGTFIIITVPTPVTEEKKPDLNAVKAAAELIGKNLSKNSVIVLESTVYPGVTEEIMAPAVERASGLKCGTDFKVGYSPERINPGDKEHAIDKITKVVSGMDAESLDRIATVYGKVTTIFKAASIKTAEAAKVIENTQRDLNIALMNELSIIFNKLGIQTTDVLDAAATKWNFLKFHPGLVGGHCIGVDPYYLTYLAEKIGYKPEIILAGRRLNDGMAKVVVNMLGDLKPNAKVLILGLTFKENVKDCRNSKVADVIKELRKKGAEVLAFDPLLEDEPELVQKEFNISLTPLENIETVDAVIMAVPHDEFKKLSLEQIGSWMDKPLLIDLRNFFDKERAQAHGFTVKTL